MYDVTFNGSKSQFLIIRAKPGRYDRCYLRIGNDILENCDSAVHLGHTINVNCKDIIISDSLSQFWRSFNLFRADFGRLPPAMQCKLFRAYCCSFYGAPLWNLQSSAFNRVCVSWRKCLRSMWRISPMSHCDVVALLSECKPLEVGIKQRFCKFVDGIL